MDSQPHRVPRYLPVWLRERLEIDSYPLRQFMIQTANSLPTCARVLDAGAGEGQYKALFQHTRYIGIDLAVGDTTWNYRDLDTISNLVDLPFGEASFDAVLCTQVLEHVPEPFQVLQEIYRVLKPDGQLFLSAPQSWQQHQKPYDYFRYTSFGLRYLFEKAGFQVKSIQPMGGYFWFLAFQLGNINWWLFPRGMPGRRWTWPLRALFGFVFQFIVTLPLFYLDRLDRLKDETFGYVCVAIKSGGFATDADFEQV